MEELIKFGLLSFTSFFTIINPLGVMPVYMTMTANLTPESRNHTAKKALFTAFLTMVFFALSGQLLFDFFGISVHGFRIAGGIIFFMMGQDMLQARLIRTKIDSESETQYVADISITPLAIPMICGPGAITNSIIMMQDADTIEKKIVLIGAMAIVCLITMFVLFGAARLIRILGDTGNKVMMRLMGLIVMVIAVEFFVSGLKPIIREILKIQ